MDANANGWHGAPIAAADDANTRCLGEESNKEWRPMLRKALIAALQKLARFATCLRLRALR
jgi:hypothetical protein